MHPVHRVEQLPTLPADAHFFEPFDSTSSEGGKLLQVGHGLELDLQDAVNTAELRRLKRSFLKVATSGIDGRLTGGAATARLFVGYLRDNLKAAAR